MLGNSEPNLDALLGSLMSPAATAPLAAQAEVPVFKTVAEVSGASAAPTPPVQVPADTVPAAHVQQQAVGIASAAEPFSVLYGVAQQDSPREYAEALAASATVVMSGSEVENSLYVAASVMAERLQSIHGVTENEAYDLARNALVMSCSAVIDDILNRRVFGGRVSAEAEYRRELIFNAVRFIQQRQVEPGGSGTLGVTTATILNRIGRKRWSGAQVQEVLDILVSDDQVSALPPEQKPGRKSVRYITKGWTPGTKVGGYRPVGT